MNVQNDATGKRVPKAPLMDAGVEQASICAALFGKRDFEQSKSPIVEVRTTIVLLVLIPIPQRRVPQALQLECLG